MSEASPIQVYLGPEEQARLNALAERLQTSKSEVIRRGLLALEHEHLHDVAEHPLLGLIGIIAESQPYPDASGLDPAIDHDQYLADAEEASWRYPSRSKKRSRRRGR